MRLLLFILFLSVRVAQADWAGRIRLGDDHFFRPQSTPVKQNELSLGLELEGKWTLSDNWRFRFEPRVRFSSAEKTIETGLDGDLRDTQFEGRLGRGLRAQVGSFIKAWEGTDGVNPMDLATMKNLRDPLNQENLGSLGITLAGGDGFFTWDSLYVPRQTPSRMPGPNSPWLPRSLNLPLQKEETKLLLPDQPQYELKTRDELDHALDHNGGLRLQLHGESWDFSVAGFEGAAQIPILFPQITASQVEFVGNEMILHAQNPIVIQPVDYRRRSAAGAFVYTRESWILRLAARHDQPLGENVLLPTWSSQAVAGVEKSVSIRDQTVIFLLQGAYGKRPVSGGVLSANDLFERALLYGFRWPWSEELTLNFMGFWDSKKGASYNRLQVQKKISDPSSIEVSVDSLSGPADSLLGVWSQQSRATFGYLYQF